MKPGPRRSPTQIAIDALERIARHEKECAERWGETRTEMRMMREQITSHSKRWEKLSWLVIGTVLVGIATILIEGI
tara:strand:- start:126 stop:353 length:228 start_codon:yes stop_codon:yes gene_type:complete